MDLPLWLNQVNMVKGVNIRDDTLGVFFLTGKWIVSIALVVGITALALFLNSKDAIHIDPAGWGGIALFEFVVVGLILKLYDKD